jgi:tRNA U34 2-thiouridine synthase MnmA/TrmU
VIARCPYHEEYHIHPTHERMPLSASLSQRLVSAANGCNVTRRCATTVVQLSTPRVVLALSGGVDSAVAAALLQETYGSSNNSDIGSAVLQTVHMSNWNSNTQDDDSIASCTSEQDWKDATAVAEHLRLNLTRQHFEREYWNQVFEPYVNDILRGTMGNPDIGCNVHVKFGALREFVRRRYGRHRPQSGAHTPGGTEPLLATGHYARLWHRNRADSAMPLYVEEALATHHDEADWVLRWGWDQPPSPHYSHHNHQYQTPPPLLLAAADPSKDQSYFLSACAGYQLSNVLFPLGEYYKKENPSNDGKPTVRQLAKDYNLPNANKRESMGICFVGKRQSGFGDFLHEYLPHPLRPLQFVDVETGAVLPAPTPKNAHAVLYTIGQGAKISGASEKYFVVDLDVAQNRVLVCAGTHHPALYADSLVLETVYWTAGEMPGPLQKRGRLRLQCRIRHLQPLIDCELRVESDGSLTVYFDKAVRGITPGQTAAFYALDGLLCLGGGPIERRRASYWEQGRELHNDVLHPAGQNDLSVPQAC